jgi:GNAT superfamily N-acetyltransferase
MGMTSTDPCGEATAADRVQLGLAGTEHVTSIAKLMLAAWPQEDADPAQISRAMGQQGHRCLVALDGDELVGFSDGFLTRSAQGVLRWELDLLAVDPAWQGHGIGQQLIRAQTGAGLSQGVSMARALIHCGNRVSQRAFSRCGYRCQPEVLALCVHPRPDELDPSDFSGWHVVPVETFAYSGIWLEGDFSSAQGLCSAEVGQRIHEQRSSALSQAAPTRPLLERGHNIRVGMLVPRSRSALIDQAVRRGFSIAGDYRTWIAQR